ncbi:DCC1-like thiol-disulfide oxidoreductase family protein [Solimonas flava]|uniref:DCC1-like thiol-disulfide oxidoreductase family protein n=1 Tax=Solimonas flava TaxID=415849 RepID=UPI00041CD3EE|nr:DCC1-like thiol-disulfide oxidoreductase family protein [Solimonas flava]
MNAPPADLTSRYPRLAEMIGIDLRTLALFRVVLGLVLLWCVLSSFRDLTAFWTDAGVMPRAWLIETDSLWRLSLYLANGQAWFAGLLLLIQAACALLFALGWRTRVAGILSFVLWASFINRNPVVLIGGDLLLCCLLFWSMFLPLAARYSVDAALSTNPPPAQNLHVSWASLGLLMQVMSVYFFSAILKSGREWWPDFTAVYYALMLDRHALPLGHWLLNFPGLMKLLSVYVYFLELLGPILIFTPYFLRPVRFALMLAFMTMHVGFLLCLQIGHFPFVSLASLTTFTGGWVWDALARRRAARENGGALRIYYDRDCGFCLKSVLLMRQLLLLPDAQIAPAQDTPRARTLLEANHSWVVIDRDEQAYLKWPAFTALLHRSPLFGWLWPLLRRPALVAPGNAVYHFVARHRGAFGRVSAVLLPQRPTAFEVGAVWYRVAGAFVALVLIWNLHTIHVLPGASYRAMVPLFRVLRIDQLWNMFAPFPLKDDGWWVFPARLADGTELDLLHPQRGAPDYDKPDNYALDQENIRWLTYRGRLWDRAYASHRLWYAKYLCRQWNDRLGATPEDRGRRLMTFKMVYMLERTPPPGQAANVEQQVVWRHECYPDETKGQIP